jgi:hypothetical protein
MLLAVRKINGKIYGLDKNDMKSLSGGINRHFIIKGRPVICRQCTVGHYMDPAEYHLKGI